MKLRHTMVAAAIALAAATVPGAAFASGTHHGHKPTDPPGKSANHSGTSTNPPGESANHPGKSAHPDKSKNHPDKKDHSNKKDHSGKKDPVMHVLRGTLVTVVTPTPFTGKTANEISPGDTGSEITGTAITVTVRSANFRRFLLKNLSPTSSSTCTTVGTGASASLKLPCTVTFILGTHTKVRYHEGNAISSPAQGATGDRMVVKIRAPKTDNLDLLTNVTNQYPFQVIDQGPPHKHDK